MGSKNDKNDVVAIVEAGSRLGMRYVPEKTLEKQDMQSIHRVCQRLMEHRTALINQIRGLGLEYVITILQGTHKIELCLPDHLENELIPLSCELFQ